MNKNDNTNPTDDTAKLQELRNLCGSPAHELRNPLLSVSSMVDGAKMHLPALVKAYGEAGRTTECRNSPYQSDHIEVIRGPERIFERKSRGLSGKIERVLG